jgi:hypothetical protein
VVEKGKFPNSKRTIVYHSADVKKRTEQARLPPCGNTGLILYSVLILTLSYNVLRHAVELKIEYESIF